MSDANPPMDDPYAIPGGNDGSKSGGDSGETNNGGSEPATPTPTPEPPAKKPDISILDEWLHPFQPFKDGTKLYSTIRIPPKPRGGGDVYSVDEVAPIELLPPDVEAAFKAHTKKVDANDLTHEELRAFNRWAWDNAPTVVKRSSHHKTLGELRQLYPQKREYVIDGVLRVGEVANMVSGPKAKKTIMAYNIMMSVITGQKLFGMFRCTQGKVLYIDNELHPEEIVSRAVEVANAMGVPIEYADTMIHFVHLRGNLVDLDNIDSHLQEFQPGEFKLIVLDALYRFFPPRTDENDNGAMARIYNKLDSIAAKLEAPLLVIHHSTKGNQSGKRVTDVGAGGSAQSRAADSHIVLRDHQEENAVVFEAAIRSSKPLSPLGLRFKWPIWRADSTLDVTKLQGSEEDDGGDGEGGGDHRGGRKVSRARELLIGGLLSSEAKTLTDLVDALSDRQLPCSDKIVRDAMRGLVKEGRAVVAKVQGHKGDAWKLNTNPVPATPAETTLAPDPQPNAETNAETDAQEHEHGDMPSFDDAMPDDFADQQDQSDTPFDV